MLLFLNHKKTKTWSVDSYYYEATASLKSTNQTIVMLHIILKLLPPGKFKIFNMTLKHLSLDNEVGTESLADLER